MGLCGGFALPGDRISSSSSSSSYGEVKMTYSHCALISVHLNIARPNGLRPNKPLPLHSKRACDGAVAGLTEFAAHLNIALPPMNVLLPSSTFPEQLRRLVKNLSQYQYIRIVDKGVGTVGIFAMHGSGIGWRGL